MSAPRWQSVLDPTGPLSGQIAREFWVATIIATVVYLATIGALFWAMRRARRRAVDESAPREVDAGMTRRMTRSVSIAIAATIAILLLYLGADFALGRALNLPGGSNTVAIRIVGHQWWWEVEYVDPVLQRRFTTANEIHVPVGRPVSLELRAQDVIHSFWVPNLAGKKDLLPGYVQSAWFRADRAGTYRGQCAEFCGAQHAKMGLVVIADPPARYEAWASQSRKPASPPVDAVQRQGELVFLSGSCAMCHTIAGTRAGSRTGPDLTHVGSRLTLAAGTLPNTPENLARWITDPQRVKPGTRMPATQLPPRDLAALVMYLEALK